MTEAKNSPQPILPGYRKLERGYTYMQLPEWARGGLERYIKASIATGSALRSLLEHDLEKFMAHWSMPPDDAFSIYKWIYNAVPGECWGSKEKVAAWLDRRIDGDDQG